jgi:hypothetical protein
MFKSKTVFVLGAGASKEAGLPLGNELRDGIVSLLDFRSDSSRTLISGDPDIHDCLTKASRVNSGSFADRPDYFGMASQICKNLHSALSIDNYLDAHSGNETLEACGKVAIVKAILDAEGKCKLKAVGQGKSEFDSTKLSDTWYHQFWLQLSNGVTKNTVGTIFDNISIISFNYDRCIERFLMQQVPQYFGIQQDKFKEIFEKLEIYHPYGVVGKLPWQGEQIGIPFGGNTRYDLLELSKGIKTFTETVDDGTVSGIRHRIAQADRIVFLGFAYHEQNLRLLKPESGNQVKQVYGTVYSISPFNIEMIKEQMRQLFKSPDKGFDVLQYYSQGNCTKLLSDYERGIRGEVGLAYPPSANWG